jgi:2'-5' RNA ligase
MATDDEMKGTWFVKLNFNFDITQQFQDLNDSSILTEKGLEKDSHLTVAKLIPHDKIGVVQKAANDFLKDVTLPLTCSIGDLGVFSNQDADVLHLQVEGKQLQALHNRLQTAAGVSWPHETFSPHITLAYLKKGYGSRYRERYDGLVTHNEISVSSLEFKKFRDKTSAPIILTLEVVRVRLAD